MDNNKSQAKFWGFIVILVTYLVSHFNNLGRDLVSEETLFLMPGRNFFEGLGYKFYWGEAVNSASPYLNPFHKPPLTSLLLGLFSFLSHDGVLGARLVPFLIGLLVVLIPFLATGSIAASFVLIFSPFFYAASAHMQTDPTVGLLGYLLICWYWYAFINGNEKSTLFFLGAVVLWLGKLEILVIAMCASLLISVILKRRWKDVLTLFVGANVLGSLIFISVCYGLGKTFGYTVAQSVLEVINTIIRISGTLRGAGTSDLLHYFDIVRGPLTLGLLLAPVLVLWLMSRKDKQANIFGVSFGILFLIPILVYLKGGYSGDGFPRYLLILFVPIVFLKGELIKSSRFKWLDISYAVVSVLVLLPSFCEVWKETGSVTVARGQVGTKSAAATVLEFTKKDDLVLGVERMLWYGRDRKWLTLEMFEAYPDNHKNARAYIPKLKGAVLDVSAFNGPAKEVILEAEKTMLENGFQKKQIGSYVVIFRP